MSRDRLALRIEPVVDQPLRQAVYALRYRAYLADGEIADDSSGVFRDEFDEQPNHILWALFEGERLVGTIRSAYYDPEQPLMLPEHKVFGDLIAAIIPRAARIVSGSRFAIDPQIDRTNKRYAFALIKQHMLVALVKADWALAAVREQHLQFYTHVLRLKREGEPRRYQEMRSDFHLCAADVLDNYASVCARYPTLRASSADFSLLNRLHSLLEPQAFVSEDSEPIGSCLTTEAIIPVSGTGIGPVGRHRVFG